MSTVPQPTLGPNGFVAPDAAAILTAVQNDLNTALGGGMNMDLATPQGQLATTWTASVEDKNNLFVYYVSQVDPRYSQGRMQDAIGRIYFMERDPATATKVVVTCVGLAGTVITTTNTKGKDDAGNIYAPTVGGTIPVGGSIDLEFANIETGPIPCPAGTLTRIYAGIPGLDTISNAADGVLGTNVESAQAFEYRRKNSVAGNAQGSVASVYAAVFASGADLLVPSIPSDVYVTHNPTGSPVTIGGVSIGAHTLFVSVVGGDDASIAKAIWTKAALGCDMQGNTTVVVTDPGSPDHPYSVPLPTYNVTFERPSTKTIYFSVNIVNNPSLPAGIATLIKDAISSAFVGGDGGQPVRIGDTTYASRFYAAVLATDPSVEIVSIFVGTSPSPGSGLSVTSRIDQHPVTANADITVNLV